MSPALQALFMTEIAPTIMATVPRVVSPAPGEDREDLVQDVLVDACKAAESLERRGRPVIPNSLAYYAIQRAKAGRRCAGSGKLELLSVGAHRSGEVQRLSLDFPMALDDSDGELLTLHDLLACRRPDPAAEAAMHLDWAAFMARLSPAERQVVQGTAAGCSGLEQAQQLGVSAPRISQLKRGIAAAARTFWGDSVLADACQHPSWQRALPS